MSAIKEWGGKVRAGEGVGRNEMMFPDPAPLFEPEGPGIEVEFLRGAGGKY